MKQQIEYIISQLRESYSYEESRELAYWILEEIYGLTRAEILIGCKDTKKNVNAQEKLRNVQDIETILQKLRAHVPVQYIFGHTEWKGLDLRVTPATLIPRPETAELVDWVLSTCDRRSPLRVMDIGTGSGCIAIALKKAAPLWQVTGVDISAEALAVARDNAQHNGVEVNWLEADILSHTFHFPHSTLNTPLSTCQINCIVSNPPYICNSEKADMEARVLNYEPHSALFVPDNDPLLFYRRIASLTRASSSMMYLFFEINEAYGQEVCDMMREMGYTNVQLKNDIYGKPRMVFGTITC